MNYEESVLKEFSKNYNRIDYIEKSMNDGEVRLVLRQLTRSIMTLSNMHFGYGLIDDDEVTITPRGYPTYGCRCGCCATAQVLVGQEVVSEADDLLEAILYLEEREEEFSANRKLKMKEL